jgi:hypothetical protein
MVEWERKISCMVELSRKISKASLTACIVDKTIAVFGCFERYKVTSLTVIQSPTPYYEMEYSSTDNIRTYFPYWCNYTRICDDIQNCGVHQYARPVMNGRWKFHVPYISFFAKKNLNWTICFYVVLFNSINTIYFNYLQFSHCKLSIHM